MPPNNTIPHNSHPISTLPRKLIVKSPFRIPSYKKKFNREIGREGKVSILCSVKNNYHKVKMVHPFVLESHREVKRMELFDIIVTSSVHRIFQLHTKQVITVPLVNLSVVCIWLITKQASVKDDRNSKSQLPTTLQHKKINTNNSVVVCVGYWPNSL
jgi:hypothetical protein